MTIAEQYRGAVRFSSGTESGTSAQRAIAMKERPTIQRMASAPSRFTSHTPTRLANAWLATVATAMPDTMGQGARKRAASNKASNWVLSPISARATTPVETNSAFKVKGTSSL